MACKRQRRRGRSLSDTSALCVSKREGRDVDRQKLDLRVRRTHSSLCDAFSALLEERRYEDITVSELCERAMIRRTTFYKHFADKNEFFVFYVWHIRDAFDLAVQVDPAEDAVGYIVQMNRQLITFFLEHDRLVDSALASNMLGTLCDMLVAQMVRSMRISVFADVDAAERLQPWLAEYMAGGILQVMRAWWLERASDPEGECVLAVMEDIIARVLA